MPLIFISLDIVGSTSIKSSLSEFSAEQVFNGRSGRWARIR